MASMRRPLHFALLTIAGLAIMAVAVTAARSHFLSQTHVGRLPTMKSSSNPIVYVEIPVTDLDRASRFYEAVFQLQLEHAVVDGYEQALLPAAEGAPGASGALVKGDVYVPAKTGPIVYFGSEDIGATVQRVVAAGGKLLYPEKQLPGLGSVAEFEDSEGNRIALFASQR